MPLHPLIRIAHIGRRRIDATWSFTHRRSPFWRLYHDRDPGAAILCGGARIPLDPGAIVLIPPETVFSALPPAEPVRHFYLHFVLDDPRRRAVREQAVRCIPLDAVLGAMLGEGDAGLWGACQPLQAGALAAWALARAGADAEADTDVGDDLSLRHIRENLGRHLAVAELARLAGCSVDHFIRLFTRRYGCTPGRYIARERIALARHLLTSTALPVEQVAERCGFASRGHLSTAFARATGRSPARFRAEAAQGSS